MKDATAEIAAGLTAGSGTDRQQRRRDSIGATYRRDPALDEMRRLHKRDPAAFEATYGARGHLLLGMYDKARDALAEDDPEEPE